LVLVADLKIVLADGGCALVRAGPGSAVLDPLRQIGDLLPRQLLIRGHLEFGVLIADALDEEAFFRMAGDNRGTSFAAREHTAERVEAQLTFRLLEIGTVAFEAVLDEEGAYLRLEEFGRRRGDGRGLFLTGVGRAHTQE